MLVAALLQRQNPSNPIHTTPLLHPLRTPPESKTPKTGGGEPPPSFIAMRLGRSIVAIQVWHHVELQSVHSRALASSFRATSIEPSLCDRFQHFGLSALGYVSNELRCTAVQSTDDVIWTSVLNSHFIDWRFNVRNQASGAADRFLSLSFTATPLAILQSFAQYYSRQSSDVTVHFQEEAQFWASLSRN
jgi:hypothetical protein